MVDRYRMERDIERRVIESDERKKKMDEEYVKMRENKPLLGKMKSELLLDPIKHQALSDIFDVLLVSVEYKRSQDKKGQASGDDEFTSRGLLNTELADPTMLKHPYLAGVVSQVIVKYKPRGLSRATFMAVMMSVMKQGTCPPLNSLLSAPYCNTSRARSSRAYRLNAEKDAEPRLPLNHLSKEISETYLSGLAESNISHTDRIFACKIKFTPRIIIVKA